MLERQGARVEHGIPGSRQVHEVKWADIVTVEILGVGQIPDSLGRLILDVILEDSIGDETRRGEHVDGLGLGLNDEGSFKSMFLSKFMGLLNARDKFVSVGFIWRRKQQASWRSG